MGTSRPDRVARGDRDRARQAAGSPAPVSPPTAPVSPPVGPVVPTQRRSGPGERPGAPTYVGRVVPPAAKATSRSKQRAPGARVVPPLLRRPPRYRYELTDLDDMFATASARLDPVQERARDSEQRRTGWKVMLGVLAVVVVLTVVAAFGVADLLRGVTSLMP